MKIIPLSSLYKSFLKGTRTISKARTYEHEILMEAGKIAEIPVLTGKKRIPAIKNGRVLAVDEVESAKRRKATFSNEPCLPW